MKFKLVPWFVAAGVAWSLGYAYNVYYGGELSWLRAMYEQKLAIAAATEAPQRLLITGGSGAHYTLDSELIEQQLGIPVINLGIDGPVGLNVILPSVLDQVRPGDVVLLIPEYLILLDEDGLGDRSGPFSLAIHRPGLGGVPPKQLAQDIMLLGVPTLRSVAKSAMDLVRDGELSGYYSDPLTERGDPTTVNTRTGEWWQLQISQSISPHAANRIAQFQEEVAARGGTLVLSLPWVYAQADQETLTNVQKTAEQLEGIAPTIYDPSSLNIKTDSSLFADTHYHLLPEARRIRARELAAQLQPVLKTINNDQ
ncbi:MAG: hypothetical protein ACFB4I_01200 [Cyanophyceae cyanobacterium]